MPKRQKEETVVRIDLGCGPNKKEGFLGVDQYEMKCVDVVCNLGKEKWPWEDNSVDEVHSAHFLEHLTNLNDAWERTHFFNEMHRVMKKGAKATLIFPHWCSNRYYGDPTHKEPFSEMGFYYLSKEWRDTQAPHTDSKWNPNGYSCDFSCSWGYQLRPDIVTRNQDYQQNAMSNYKEVIQDIIATLVKA
jgi:cyclopropane fatty-acyl-phospholipid synthase-like methyltransferase